MMCCDHAGLQSDDLPSYKAAVHAFCGWTAQEIQD